MTRFIPRFGLLALVALSPAVAQQVPSGTVLVANMNDDSVWLVDAQTGEHRATVQTHIAPHEIAVSVDGRLAAITNYGDRRGPGNLVQMVDVAQGTVTHEFEVEGHQRLHGAAFLPGDSLLAMTSERTGEILIVSTRDGAIRRAMSTGGQAPHMLALAGGWIYTANIVSGSVARIDPAGTTEANVWPAGATRTEGVAATPDGRQGWTGSMDSGTVVGIDGASGEVVAKVEGLGIPYRLAVTPNGETVLVSDPESGSLVLIDRRAGRVAGRVDVDAAAEAAGHGSSASPQGFALSRDGAWAFLSAKEINRVAVIHLASRRVVRFLDAGAGPDGIAFSPVTTRGADTRD